MRPKAISQPRVIAICSKKVSLVRQSQIVNPHRASFRAACTAQFRRVQVAKYQDQIARSDFACGTGPPAFLALLVGD
jgi:hypothetical protein